MLRRLVRLTWCCALIALVSSRYYDTLTETCQNSVIRKYSVKSAVQCGHLCDITKTCSAFCVSAKKSSCFLHEIVNFGAGTLQKGLMTYKMVDTLQTHQQAFDNCIDIGGHLALPMDEKQEKIIWELSGKRAIYLGADDLTQESVFMTSELEEDDKKVINYTNWMSGEPNGGYGDNEDCLELTTDKGWFYDNSVMYDVPCDGQRYSVCQAPRHEICTQLPNGGNLYQQMLCYQVVP